MVGNAWQTMIIFLLFLTMLSSPSNTAPEVDYSAFSYPPVQETEPLPTEEQLSTESSIQQMALDMGITTPVVIGSCTLFPEALGCFIPEQNLIVITEAGLSEGMEFMPCLLSHEARHAYQHANGLIKYDANGKISNRSWIEEDADRNEVC